MSKNDRRLYLITGIPAAGKTYFCEWLEKHRGFRRYVHDTDKELQRRLGMLTEMQRRGGPAHEVIESTRELTSLLTADNRPTVIEWGFTPDRLPTVELLKGSGWSAWWFDGPYERARLEFVRRGGLIPVQGFDGQTAAIRSARPQLDAAFAGRRIETLRSDGCRMKPEVIAYKIGIDRGPMAFIRTFFPIRRPV